jgi:hypothetical protein
VRRDKEKRILQVLELPALFAGESCCRPHHSSAVGPRARPGYAPHVGPA